MTISPNYEVVDIAGEVLAVPVGAQVEINKDFFTFTNAAAFLLKKVQVQLTVDEMAALLTSEFNIDTDTAQKDVYRFTNELLSIGLIVE